MFTIIVMAHRHNSLSQQPLLCLVLYRYRKKKSLPHKLMTANTS